VEALWAYALGILEPHEEQRVCQWVAADARAAKQLQEIRRIVANPPPLPGPSLADAARAAFARALGELKDAGISLVAAIVNVPAGLVPAMVNWPIDWEATTPSDLHGEPEQSQPGAPAPAERIVVRGPKGQTLSVARGTGGQFHVVVEADGAPDDWVKVFRLVPGPGGLEAKDTPVRGWFHDGRASLEGCPGGFLRLAIPGSEAMDIYLGVLGPAGP
jgi:anti-sigma factor RsiW